jgi:pimeloyl-ACP methyl ester carboxylesterase
MLVLAACLVLPSCSGNGESGGTDVGPVTAPSSTTSSTTAAPGKAQFGSPLTWQPCGEVECGTLRVAPREGDDPAGSSLRVAAYRRAPSVAPAIGTLVLLPDWEGFTARELAEKAPLVVGPAAHQFTVVAVSPRGFYDSSPLPCGVTFAHVTTPVEAQPVAVACSGEGAAVPGAPMGVLAAVRDLEALVSAGELGQVSVVGWGRGATIAAAWKLLHPASIFAAVLDSPSDPGVAPAVTARRNLQAEDAAVAAVMKWCTSHISCPLVENAAKRVQFVIDDIVQGKANAGATVATVRHAFLRTVMSGDFGAFFHAMEDAEKMDFAPLVAVSGQDAKESSLAARIAGTCSDLSAADIDTVIAEDAAFEETVFHAGYGATIPLVCAQMPVSMREPLGTVRAATGARSSRVKVYVSATDGVVSPDAVRAFAKRADWRFRAVKSSRHLVVGFDRATTLSVSNFLLGK